MPDGNSNTADSERELKLHKEPATDSHPKGAVPFNVALTVYKEIAQGMLTARQNSRSIESGVAAFLPLASDEARDKLLRIQGHAEQISVIANDLYAEIALLAFNN